MAWNEMKWHEVAKSISTRTPRLVEALRKCTDRYWQQFPDLTKLALAQKTLDFEFQKLMNDDLRPISDDYSRSIYNDTFHGCGKVFKII